MVIRIHDVGKWRLLPIGEVIELSGGERRNVRLEFNTEAPTRLDVWERGAEEDRSTFLAVVQGLEAVLFSASGKVHVSADSEGEVWYFTNNVSDADAAEEAESAIKGVSYANVMQRRARNPQLEMMQFKLEENINRRLDAQSEEYERRLAELQALTPHDEETGEVEDDKVSDDDAARIAVEAAAAAASAAAAADKGPDVSPKP